MNDINELSENERKMLHDHYNKPGPPADLEEKTIALLKQRDLFKKTFFTNYYFKLSFGLLIIAFVFFAGYFIRGKSSQSKNLFNGKNEYLMLLFESVDFISNNSHAKEYADWYYGLKKQNIMSAGEELQSKNWSIVLRNAKPSITEANSNINTATGFFIFYASSPAEALKIASTCPHLKYNGSVEVHSIQNHN